MTYIPPMGDGPVTSPDQIIEETEVPRPTVSLMDSIASVFNNVKSAISGAKIPVILNQTPAPEAESGAPWLLIAGGALAAYFLLRKRK